MVRDMVDADALDRFHRWYLTGRTSELSVYADEFLEAPDLDSLDPESWNVLVFEDSVPVATGRIWWSNGSFWLGDIAVLESHRGKHLGDLVLRLLLYKAQSHSAREVRLRCPRSLTGFFSRLGLSETQAADDSDVEMMIAGDRIDLDTCSRCPKKNCPNRHQA